MNVPRVCITRCLKVRTKYVTLSVVVFIGLVYFGAFTHIFEVDFYENFSYPLEGDIRQYVEQLKRNEQPQVKPINIYNYSYVSNCKRKCKTSDMERLRLVYIIKSAPHHFDRRIAIRNSWGYERRFSDVPIRTVFVLGVVLDNSHLQMEIDQEQNKYGDIVQAEFVDTYFNNTIKTMMGFEWAVQFCLNSKFYMFSDDDMYISTKNVLQFIRNPTHYPEYLQTPVYSLKQRKKRAVDKEYRDNLSSFPLIRRHINQVMDFELPEDVVLFAGYVFISAPHRHQSSKWYVPLSEYPYHMWPPYVTAGAFILSHNALVDMYYASFYTKHFRFDDIFLGLVAKKIDIEPFHSKEFYFYKKDYNVFNYKYVVASHGYDDPNELLKVWNEQRSSGHA